MERYLWEEGTEAPPNGTNCTGPPTGTVFQVPMVTERLVVVLLLAVLTLLTALANAAVIAAICTTKKLHLPANYLICSLAITDFLVAVLVMPISVAYIAMQSWALGWAVCEVWLSVDMTCCTSSILHLCAIALDRFWAITKAIEYARKRTARRAAGMVAAAWVISIFISLPPLFWRYRQGRPSTTTNTVLSKVPSSSQCIIEHDHVGYTVYSTLGAFYIPMGLILVLYYRIYSAAKTLYQKRGSSRHFSGRSTDSQNSLNNHHHQCRVVHTFCVSDLSTTNSDPASGITAECDRFNVNLNVTIRMPSSFEAELESSGADERNQICTLRERKAARILGLILGAFILCWLPFFVKELLVGLQLLRQPSPEVSDFLTWLGYLNSLINPLLYTSFNEDFKLAFKKLLKRKGHT